MENVTAISEIRQELRAAEAGLRGILSETGNQAAQCILGLMGDIQRIEHALLFGGTL